MMKSGQEGDEVRRARGKGMTGEGWRDAGVQRGSGEGQEQMNERRLKDGKVEYGD